MRQYIKFISYLQIIGIILVVLGHSFHEYPEGHGYNTLIYRMIYSFHMPLFMFVSGFLLVYTTKIREYSNKATVKDFIISKMKRLLLPFAVLSIVTFIPRAYLSDMADNVMEINLHSFFQGLFYSNSLIIPFYWFIQACFILLVLTYAAITIGEKSQFKESSIYFSIILLFIILPLIPIEYSEVFSIDKAINYGIYFAIGAAYSRYATTIDRYIPWTSAIFMAFSIAFWVITFFLTENAEWFRLCSFIGIVMCISIAKIIERYNIIILDHLTGVYYMIFLLSWYCNIVSQQVLHHFVELPWWCYTVLSLISGIYVPWLVYRYLENHYDKKWVRVTATILGHKFKSQ